MRIAKYHGTGNDFVFVEDLDDRAPVSPALVRALCDRHRGIGADGLIRVVRGTEGDFVMDYWNRDGEVAQMCGNGIRCLGKYVFDRGLTDREELDVETRAGMKHLVMETDGGRVSRVTVDMGPPAFELGSLPMQGDPESTFLEEPFEAAGRTWRASAVSMGNPHLVVFVDPEEDLAALDVPHLGPQIEHDPRFAERTNVEFVHAVDGRVAMRVWERGSGETMACGTGACAVLVAANLAGLAKRQSDIEVPGGVLFIDWRDDDHVFLTGPATFVFDADLDPRWVREAEAAFA
jgi:diaminopimelate epimerase